MSTAKEIGKLLQRMAVSEGIKRTVEPVDTSQESGTKAQEKGGIAVSAATNIFAGNDESPETESHNGDSSTAAQAQSMTA